MDTSRSDRTKGPPRLSRLADDLGINLRAAVSTGVLPAEDLQAMLARCDRCPEPRLCDVFLDRHADGTDRAPDYCPNAATLAELRSLFGPVGEGWPDRAPARPGRKGRLISRQTR